MANTDTTSQGPVEGRWVEKSGEPRAVAHQRRNWREFTNALNRLTGFNHA